MSSREEEYLYRTNKQAESANPIRGLGNRQQYKTHNMESKSSKTISAADGIRKKFNMNKENGQELQQ